MQPGCSRIIMYCRSNLTFACKQVHQTLGQSHVSPENSGCAAKYIFATPASCHLSCKICIQITFVFKHSLLIAFPVRARFPRAAAKLGNLLPFCQENEDVAVSRALFLLFAREYYVNGEKETTSLAFARVHVRSSSSNNLIERETEVGGD